MSSGEWARAPRGGVALGEPILDIKASFFKNREDLSMAFDEVLAGRTKEALKGQPTLVQKKMFGGIAFMVRGHMCCGVAGNDLMARIGTGEYEAMLKKSHVREMDFTGKPLRGFIYVDQAGLKTERQLRYWVTKSLDFVLTLPPK
jgi:hypothetical protein